MYNTCQVYNESFLHISRFFLTIPHFPTKTLTITHNCDNCLNSSIRVIRDIYYISQRLLDYLEILYMAEGDILSYLESNNDDVVLEDADGNTQRAKLVKQPGIQNVDIPGAKTAFGEVVVAEFQPQCGWSFNYNINDAIIQKIEVGSATVTQDGSFAKLETGTTPGSLAVVRTRRPLVYTPGIGAIARFTYIFDPPVEGTTQLIGPGTGTDGWFFGYDGLQFGILRRSNDVDYWTYQADWSEDIRSDLDPTKGNVYQISYQWLGFGMQYFGIENDNGNIESVHKLKYANLNTDVSVRNPSLPLSAIVFNGLTSSNITNRTPSAVGGLQGEKFSPAYEALIAYERIVTIPSGVETYLFGIQNPTTWLTKDNRLYVLPKQFAAASEGNKPIVFRVYGGVTITIPVWVDVAPDISPLQYDESGTWVLNGEAQVFTLPLGKADNQIVNLDVIDAEVQPDQTFAVTAESTGISDVIVGINFKSRT